MERNAMLEHDPFIPVLAEKLHIHGYYAFYGEHYNETDMEQYRKHLFTTFNNIVWIELDARKKYMIVDHRGRNTVMKLIEGMLNTRRTLRANQAMAGTDTTDVDKEITHFSKLVHILKFTTFRM
ncbi:hypothetical protein HUB98_11175 [Paenibacillus barcinonensis]|uniref:Uncharacterized protein n=1 Tax=Paenibacillus barcinonensis TaxID=198119 RepID=A0A2V4V705_PAEBA|nr:hypothetical protein [Paenibacillus barcinonensis]PYE48329.1 hypothetical protein DFQ00_109183 [Paenibacillus barcinonensis]QKS56833.1 hypothetical protein HUB98_11175 [Paenibacillus barcinonensis]